MNTASKLKIFKSGDYTYLYIYYKFNGKLIRINTKQKFIKGMHKQDLFYNSRMENYEVLNKQIEALKFKVDRYIANKLQYQYKKVDQKECSKFLRDGILPSSQPTLPIIQKKKAFMDYFDEFYTFKDVELQNKPSLKDYKSLKNAFLDYEKANNVTLTFDTINDFEFFSKFRNFLYLKHSDDSKTLGDMNSNTVQKRISSLKTFMSYLQRKKYYIFDNELFKYKIQKFPTDFVTLDRGEISQLENLDITDKNWEKIFRKENAISNYQLF